MTKFLLAAGMALVCLAALWAAAWLADGWRGMQRFGPWRILPDAKNALKRMKAVQVDDSCLGLTAEVFSAAPQELSPGLTLRAGSSGLLLATAAALTAPALPEADRAAVTNALAPIGMQPERIARRWPQQSACFVAGHEALLVQDGRQKRFFLCLHAPDMTPSHVFFDKEYALSEAQWHALRDHVNAQAAPFHAAWHYYTGLWEENGPASVTYLGVIACRWQPSEAAVWGLERLQSAGFFMAEGADSLLVTAVEGSEHPLQMVCEEGEATSFADALCTLRAQWKRRNRTMKLLLALACCTCLATIPLEMCIQAPALARLIAASSLPLLLFAGTRKGQLLLPKRSLTVLLPVAITCLLGALLPLTLLLPGTDFTLPGAPAIALGVLAMGTWGTQLALLVRQKGRKVLAILSLLLGLGACLYLAATLSGALYAAFGAVLGALITLPVWCMQVR